MDEMGKLKKRKNDFIKDVLNKNVSKRRGNAKNVHRRLDENAELFCLAEVKGKKCYPSISHYGPDCNDCGNARDPYCAQFDIVPACLFVPAADTLKTDKSGTSLEKMLSFSAEERNLYVQYSGAFTCIYLFLTLLLRSVIL